MPTTSPSSASHARCRQSSASAPTGSCRSRSRTCESTPARRTPRCECGGRRRGRGRGGEHRFFLLLLLDLPPHRRAPGHESNAGSGLGQVGMRERVAAAGGTLELGPRARGGYLVRARPRCDAARRCARDPGARRRRPGARARRLRTILDSEDGIEVVGEAADGDAASRPSRSFGPTSSAWTCRCPAWTGSRHTSHHGIRASAAAVLVLTTFNREDCHFAAVEAGASDSWSRNPSPDSSVEAGSARDALLSPDVTRRVIEAVASGAEERSRGRLPRPRRPHHPNSRPSPSASGRCWSSSPRASRR